MIKYMKIMLHRVEFELQASSNEPELFAYSLEVSKTV